MTARRWSIFSITYPHDELFQISEDELLRNSLGILQLQERARVALFMRRDPFDRFVTCLIYVPRDRYDSACAAASRNSSKRHSTARGGFGMCASMTVMLARAFVTIHLTRGFATSRHRRSWKTICAKCAAAGPTVCAIASLRSIW